MILTEAVDRGTFFKMRAQMMNVHADLRKSLEEHVCSMAGDAARIARNLFSGAYEDFLMLRRLSHVHAGSCGLVQEGALNRMHCERPEDGTAVTCTVCCGGGQGNVHSVGRECGAVDAPVVSTHAYVHRFKGVTSTHAEHTKNRLITF